MSSTFTVYGGNGHRLLRTLPTKEKAIFYAAEFEQMCRRAGVSVPRCIIEEEAQK